MFLGSVVLLIVFHNTAAANINLGGSQIHLYQEKVPFAEAVNRCHQQRMRLVGSSSDLGFINRMFFADLTDENAGNSSEPQSEYWFLNTTHYWENYKQPSNLWSPCQKLIIKYRSGNTSASFGYDSCSKLHRYICESPERSQGEIDGFLVSPHTALEFLEASKVCKLFNRQLAYVNNKKENMELTHLIRKELGIKSGLFWIGALHLKINGEFRWYPSNKYLTYSNWLYSVQPNETCAALAFHEDQVSSPWVEVHCTRKLRFICRKPFPKKCVQWIPNPERPIDHTVQKRASSLEDIAVEESELCTNDQNEDRIEDESSKPIKH